MANYKVLPPEGLEERYERYKKKIKHFTIMNDVFMRNVLKEKECTEYILQVILQKDLRVVTQILQKDYKNLQGRSAILDCVAKDTEDKQFNIEIQGDREGASPKRARYHSGLLDMNTLNSGEAFDLLPETYVIFIAREDILGDNLPIYHIDRQISETEEIFDDEQHIIYVNSKKQDNTELGRLMHDLHCKEADTMYSSILSARVRELKETEKGVNEMCKELEEIYNEGHQQGELFGVLKTKKETALSLFKMQMPIEQIAQAMNIETSTVQSWIDEKK